MLIAGVLASCTAPPAAPPDGNAAAPGGAEAARPRHDELDRGQRWVGATTLLRLGWPVRATQALRGEPHEISTQVYPAGAATRVTLNLSGPDDERTVELEMRALSHDAGPFGHNTELRAEVPQEFIDAGAPFAYWIRVEFGDEVQYDSNDGKHFWVQPVAELSLPHDSLAGWRWEGIGASQAGPEGLSLTGAGGLGLLWSSEPTPPDFVLDLEVRLSDAFDNSGIMVRFPDPTSKGYENRAWVPVHFGYEVQLDEQGRPDGATFHRTGAVYGERDQHVEAQPPLPPGEWTPFTIRTVGDVIEVWRGVQRTTRFVRPAGVGADRGAPSRPGAPRFIGLQAHTGQVMFRNIRIRSSSGEGQLPLGRR